MPWNESQLVFLRELGLPWARHAAAPSSSPAVAPVVAPAASPQAKPVLQTEPEISTPAASTATPPQAPTRPEIAGAGWAELQAAVVACQACGLCRSRKQTVFGVGSMQSQWMVVGEAPGEQEDLQGEPFVGAAGRLLDQMLAALKLSRHAPAPPAVQVPSQQVYIANTLKCRPPGNRNPQPDELQQCEPFLRRQLDLLQPRIILAMGRFAVQLLLRSSEPIGKLRGRVHRYQGVPLVVTYHPAYLLRNPMDKSKAWADLCLAADVFEQRAAVTRDGLAGAPLPSTS